MGKYFKKIFWLVISIAMIFQSSYLSFSEEIINQNNSSSLMEETIKEDIENIQTDGEVSVDEKIDKNAIKNSPQANNEPTNISTFSTKKRVKNGILSPTQVFEEGINKAKEKVPNPGDVYVYPAKVTEDPTYANTWEVMMRVVAHDSVKKSKVVLVIDTSGSMKKNERMEKTKEAAKVFVNTLYPSESEKKADIAIVGYESEVSQKAGFNSSRDQLMSAIDGLSAEGGTFTQGGVHRARELLKGGGNENKYIVLLSDGQPTFCYGVNNINGLTFKDIDIESNKYPYTRTVKLIDEDISEINYNYDDKKIGSGSSIYAYTGYKYGRKRVYMDCGRAAINEAGFAKTAGVTMYTVGLQLEEEGRSILNKMANKGKFIGVDNPNYLKDEFSKIASQIYNATNEASVNVNFQKGIELQEGVKVKNIDYEGGAVRIEDRKPVWDLGTVDTPLEDGSEYKYAYIRFRVSVNDKILSTANPNKTKLLGNVNFTYKDKDGNDKTIPIEEKTEQDVKLYLLRKIVKDSTSIDNEHRIFKFMVTGNGYEKEYKLKPSEIGSYKNCKILKKVKRNATYSIYELNEAFAYDENNNNSETFNVTDYYNHSDIYASNDLKEKGTKVVGATASGGVTPAANITIDGQGDKFLTVENSEKKELAKMTVNKIIKMKSPASRARSAKNTNLPKETSFSFSIKDGENTVKNGDVKIGSGLKGSTTFDKLSFKEYTLHENEESIQPNTPFKPENNDIKFKITLYDVLKNKDKGKEINFVNEFDSNHNSASVDFTAHKIWVNGNKADFDKASFKLFRTVDGLTKEEIKNVTPTKVKNDEYKFDYKWSKLPRYNKELKEYTYSVKEAGVRDNKVTINGNTYVVSQKDNTITNTYQIPKIGKFEATKEWSVDRSMADKVTYPTMQFVLYRKTASVPGEAVAKAEPKEINGTNLTATWTNLDKTNKDGEVYTYYVKENFKEKQIENDNWVLGEYDSSKDKITNKLEDPHAEKGKLTVKKELLVNTNTNTNTRTRARRSISDPIKFKFELTGPYSYKEEFELAPGEKKEFKNLYFGEYKLEETDAKGYTPSYSENSGKVTLTRAAKDKNIKVTNTIDNTSDASTVSFIAKKKWIGGPKKDHKAIQLNLMRNVDGGKKEVVVTNPKTSEEKDKNAFDYEWSKLPRYNENGKEYTYSVEEAGVRDNKVTINGNTYVVSQKDNTITNTYQIPKIAEFKATKEWSVDRSMADKVTYPTMQFVLYRKTASGTDEKVAKAEPKEINKNNLTATWTDLDKTNKDGEVYTYYVKESFKKNQIENENWVLGEYDFSKDKITNKLEDPHAEKGKLTVKKELLVNTNTRTRARRSISDPIKFKFKLTGPYSYREEFELAPGEKKEFKNLYFGEYQLVETDTKGYTPSYSEKLGKVTLTRDAKDKNIKVTNTIDNTSDASIVSFKAKKKWIGGPKNDHKAIQLNLMRNVDGGKKEVVVTNPKTSEEKDKNAFDYEWSKLPRYNKYGKEYTYSVEEAGVSGNKVTINGNTYEVSQKDNTITNTYQIPKIAEFKASKEWSVDKSMANKVTYPTMQFVLYRKTASGTGEKVAKADPKDINGTNLTATWTDLDKTNKDGEVYTYYVKESFKKNQIENENWVLGEYDSSKDKITNKLEDDKAKMGKLTIEKKFTNIPKYLENKEFDFVVQGPYAYSKTVKIKAGSKMEIDGLYYGNYTIREVIPENALYKVSGSNEQNISLRKNEPANNVIFTNILNDVSTINISVNKEWKGDGPRSSVKINLLINGKKTDKSLDLNKKNNWKGEFVNLEKRDDNGELITYSIAEEKINNYETAYSNNSVKNKDGKITVINTYKKKDNPYIPYRPGNGGNSNNDITVDRIYGKTRIETAVELSKKINKADTVIIANAYKFPDAMASAPLAYLKDGVILLTTGDKSKGVPKATLDEIQRLKVKNIIVVGGNSSVSDEEVSVLKKVAKNVKRIGGVDRYQTSELIAYEVNKLTDNKNKVVVASGEVFPDSLSVGSYASRKGLAIILSKHNQLPLYSKQAIKNIGANDFIIVGGVNTISKSVEESINGKKVRYAGLDRYETAKEIAENTYSNPKRVFIASGEIFIDSLVVGPVAGRFEAPILLTKKNSLPKPTKDFTMKSSVKHITIVGGVNTVSKKVENELYK